MSTGSPYVEITPNRLIETPDLKDRFFDYLHGENVTTRARVYDDPGVFSPALQLSSPAVDQFSIAGSSLATDGLGYILNAADSLSYCQAVQFENTLGVEYEIAMHRVEAQMIHAVDNTIRMNPDSGQAEYVGRMELVGEKGAPDAVQIVGPDIVLTIDSLCEAGVSHAGRLALVYLKVPLATTSAVGMPIVTVAFTGGQNRVTVLTDKLGQSTVSTNVNDYEVVVLGPTVRRNSTLVGVPGYVMVGKVTGAGAGNSPTVFETTPTQQLITVSLSDLNNAFETFAQAKELESGKAGTKAPISQIVGAPVTWGAAHAVHGQYIYVFGGSDGVGSWGSLTNRVFRYDTTSDTWIERANVPDNFNVWMSAATIGDIIYIAGGHDGATNTGTFRTYNTGTNAWSTLASLPNDRHGGSLVTMNNNELYYIGGDVGGYGAGSARAEVYKYEVGINTWTAVADLPTAKARSNVVVYNGQIYALGGGTGTGHYSSRDLTCYRYDPAANAWVTLASIPDTEPGHLHNSVKINAPVNMAAVGEINGGIHLMCGGGNRFGMLSAHMVYNVLGDSWARLPRPTVPYTYATSYGLVEGVMYMFGGLVKKELNDFDLPGNGFAVDISQVFTSQTGGSAINVGTVTKNASSHTETTLAVSMKELRTGHAVCKLGEGFLITGGYKDGLMTTPLDSAEMYWPQTQTSCWVRDMPDTRFFHGAVSYNFGAKPGGERAIILQGWESAGVLDQEIWEFDPSGNSWTVQTTTNSIKRSYGTVVIGELVWLVGGFSDITAINTVEVFDLRKMKNLGQFADIPNNMLNPTVSVRDKVIYEFGTATSNRINMLNVAFGTGEDMANHSDSPTMPGNFLGGGAQEWNGRFYIYDPDGAQIVEFDPDAYATTTIATGLTARYYAQMQILDGSAYLFGGSSSSAQSDSFDEVIEITLPEVQPFNSLNPENFSTGMKSDSVGFKQGQTYGLVSWSKLHIGDFVRMSAEANN